ncbi:MAG: four helix bundle protein [Bacteroidota bacterium]|nr:four helix bundle protein [Bacteroidota bacterium]
MQSNKPNIIVEKTLEFSLLVNEYAELLEEKRKYVIARQLLKSGTSIGANVREAQNAESKFKLKISAKEADETEYWLLLCQKSKYYPDCSILQEKFIDINKILSKIIASSKRSNK